MNILVPTDFSGCADYALEAAIQIARIKKASLILYHAPELPGSWETDAIEIKIKDQINQAKLLQIKSELNRRELLCKEAGIDCKKHIGTKKLLDQIGEVCDENDCELIVMGSHGLSGKNEWFIGSNTQKVLRKVNCNVLVIKNRLEELRIKRVLFASSLSPDDKDALIKFIDFMTPFKIEELHLIAINTSGFFSQPMILMEELLNDFAALVKGVKCTTHFYPDYSVESGIRHFSEKNPMDLVAISNHKSNPVKRIFLGSNVEMLVNHSSIPVLSLDYL